MENLLYPLSNPTSEAIRRRLVRIRFFVGVEEGGEENHIQWKDARFRTTGQ